MARFENNNLEQGLFLSINLGEQFNENTREYHVKDFINKQVELNKFEKYYKNDEKGRLIKNPKDMIAAILYGYITGNRSSRDVEELLQKNIGFMYVSNRLRVDHSVICDFKVRFKGLIEELFAKLLYVLNNLNEIDWDIIVEVGTRIKANASKSMNVGGEITDKKLEIYRNMSRKIVERDLENDQKYDDGAIDEKKYHNEKKRISRQKKLYEHMIEKIEEYKQSVKAGDLDGDEKYNLTDPESKVRRGENRRTFIQGYNALFALSNNDIILDYRGDTESEKHGAEKIIRAVEEKKRELEEHKKTTYIMDSGFENMNTILKCQKRGIDVYIELRETSFSGEAQKRKYFHDVEKRDNGYYLSCIGGRTVKGSILGTHSKVSFSFRRKTCTGCTNYEQCYGKIKETTKSKTVVFDLFEIENKEGITQYISKLKSKEGRKIYHKRIGKEHVFANIKTQKGYHQTAYRGKEKLNMELGWISIAHNLMKYVNYQLSYG